MAAAVVVVLVVVVVVPVEEEEEDSRSDNRVSRRLQTRWIKEGFYEYIKRD